MHHLTKALISAIGIMVLPGLAAAATNVDAAVKPRPPLSAHRHFGIPIYGPQCRFQMSSPYCDYSFYKGPIFLDGRWVYGGNFPHRYWHGNHQFWYRGAWRDGGWGHGGLWSGHGGYRGANF
jgi:hypothetical protein